MTRPRTHFINAWFQSFSQNLMTFPSFENIFEFPPGERRIYFEHPQKPGYIYRGHINWDADSDGASLIMTITYQTRSRRRLISKHKIPSIEKFIFDWFGTRVPINFRVNQQNVEITSRLDDATINICFEPGYPDEDPTIPWFDCDELFK